MSDGIRQGDWDGKTDKKAITWDFQLPIHKVKDLIKICHNFHRLTLWDS